MKTKLNLVLLFLLGLLSGTTADAHACPPGDPDFFTVSGIVKDAQTNRPLPNVNVIVPGTGIGTVSNDDGGFSIKIKRNLQARKLLFSHLGYVNQQIDVSGEDTEEVIVKLVPEAKPIDEVVVLHGNPRELVEAAIDKIEHNYSKTPDKLTGFYRETVRKRDRYITISEAILDLHKTPYSENVDRERIVVEKGRQLLSPRAADTLMVKLQGGPYLGTYIDVVKNPNLVLNKKELDFYQFSLGAPAVINERLHYVVHFVPYVIMPYALLGGDLYIDYETLAFSRVELRLDIQDRNKATQAILRKKPMNLKFKPEELSYLITYREQNGEYVLNYIRTQIRFKCDWKRRLFSTNYTVVSEMVVTDRQKNRSERIPRSDAFRANLSLSDEVKYFYDENFWEDYNIIEPTESLENAVSRLKKQHR